MRLTGYEAGPTPEGGLRPPPASVTRPLHDEPWTPDDVTVEPWQPVVVREGDDVDVTVEVRNGLPAACPVCGAYSLAPDSDRSALLAVCDVLVVKALESMGKWMVRESRSRYRAKGTHPWHEIHTLWQPDEAMVTKALRSAWDVVPAMLDTHGCCGITSRQVTRMLDEYVHDLCITGTAHSLGELQYRFQDRLGLPVYARPPAPAPVRIGQVLD